MHLSYQVLERSLHFEFDYSVLASVTNGRLPHDNADLGREISIVAR